MFFEVHCATHRCATQRTKNQFTSDSNRFWMRVRKFRVPRVSPRFRYCYVEGLSGVVFVRRLFRRWFSKFSVNNKTGGRSSQQNPGGRVLNRIIVNRCGFRWGAHSTRQQQRQQQQRQHLVLFCVTQDLPSREKG